MIFDVFSSKNIGFCNVCWSGQKKNIIKSHQKPLVLNSFFFFNNCYTCQHDIFFFEIRYTYQHWCWSNASKYKIPYKFQWFLTVFLTKTLDFIRFAEVVQRKKSAEIIKIHWFWIGFFSTIFGVRVNMIFFSSKIVIRINLCCGRMHRNTKDLIKSNDFERFVFQKHWIL